MRSPQPPFRNVNVYLAAAPPTERRVPQWFLRLNEGVIGLSRAAYSRGAHLIVVAPPAIARTALFLAEEYRPDSVRPSVVSDEKSQYSHFSMHPPSALIVLGGNGATDRFVREFRYHFQGSPVYIFPSTGGVAAALIEDSRAIDVERETEDLRRAAVERGARFLVPPYGIWMEMILDRPAEPSPRG
jgi:hypothetical protein